DPVIAGDDVRGKYTTHSLKGNLRAAWQGAGQKKKRSGKAHGKPPQPEYFIRYHQSMRKSALLAIVVAAGLSAQPLQETLRSRIGGFQGTVTLFAKNLDTGASVGINE